MPSGGQRAVGGVCQGEVGAKRTLKQKDFKLDKREGEMERGIKIPKTEADQSCTAIARATKSSPELERLSQVYLLLRSHLRTAGRTRPLTTRCK